MTMIITTTNIQHIFNQCSSQSISRRRKVTGLDNSPGESAAAGVGGDLCRREEVGVRSTSDEQHLLAICILVNPTSVISSSFRQPCESGLPSVGQLILGDQV